MKLTALLLGVLFAIVIAVMMAGQMSALQDEGELLTGAVGTFFGLTMMFWVLMGFLVAAFGLFAVIFAVMR